MLAVQKLLLLVICSFDSRQIKLVITVAEKNKQTNKQKKQHFFFQKQEP